MSNEPENKAELPGTVEPALLQEETWTPISPLDKTQIESTNGVHYLPANTLNEAGYRLDPTNPNDARNQSGNLALKDEYGWKVPYGPNNRPVGDIVAAGSAGDFVNPFPSKTGDTGDVTSGDQAAGVGKGSPGFRLHWPGFTFGHTPSIGRSKEDNPPRQDVSGTGDGNGLDTGHYDDGHSLGWKKSKVVAVAGAAVTAVAVTAGAVTASNTCGPSSLEAGKGFGTTLSLTREANLTAVAQETAEALGTVFPATTIATPVPTIAVSDAPTPGPPQGQPEQTEQKQVVVQPPAPVVVQPPIVQPPVVAQDPQQPGQPAQGQLSGNYNAKTAVAPGGDPAQHAGHIDMPSLLPLNLFIQRNVDTGAITIDLSGPFPWVNLHGNAQFGQGFDSSGGHFNATGMATVAGFPNVEVDFDGSVTVSSGLHGNLIMGSNGALPTGRSITYSVDGTK